MNTREEGLRSHRYSYHASAALSVLFLISPICAHAFEIETGAPDLKVRWDNTVKLSSAYRLEDPDPAVLNANADDGDRSFEKGFTSQRADLLSELDMKYRNFSMRFSGAAWYDRIYNQTNENMSASTINHLSVPANEFTDATRKLMGRKAELLDAFFAGKFTVDDTPVTFRVGRYAMIWGESLFFGSNAAAAAMAPIDIVKLTSVPSSQTKEVTRPVGQASFQIQPNDALSLSAYYQFDYEMSRLPASGSFLSSGDPVGAGNERFLLGVAPGIPIVDPEKPSEQGQYGIQLRYLIDEFDFGLYFLNYHTKTPASYLIGNGGPPVALQLVYPQNTKAYGVSFNTTQFETAFSGEFSIRTNAPLVSLPQLSTPARRGDNDDNPLYAVGRTAHLNLSAFKTLERSFLSDSGALLFEAAFNDVLKVSKNRAALQPFGSEQSVAFRMVFSNTYFNIMPGLDLTVPIGASYSPAGRSLAVGNFAVDHGGDVSVGVNLDYLQDWHFTCSYIHFYGDPNPASVAGGVATFDQAFRDRDFISVSLSRTF